jgi:hypothetical protein
MTFEEWFEQVFVPEYADVLEDPYDYRLYARLAWEAGFQAGQDAADGVEAIGGPINASDPNAGLPGTTEYTYEEFSRDSERW